MKPWITKKNKVAIITKVDKISDPALIVGKKRKLEKHGFSKILTTTVKNDKSIQDLIEEIKTYLPEGELFYAEDEITDKSMRFIAKEYIREAAIELVKEELPYSIGIEIEAFEEKETKINVRANLIVERTSQKGIVIGANGRVIKEIGATSRKRLSATFDTRVNVELHVKVRKNWTDNELEIKRMGY